MAIGGLAEMGWVHLNRALQVLPQATELGRGPLPQAA